MLEIYAGITNQTCTFHRLHQSLWSSVNMFSLCVSQQTITSPHYSVDLIFLQSCETKSGTESLGSRLYVYCEDGTECLSHTHGNHSILAPRCEIKGSTCMNDTRARHNSSRHNSSRPPTLVASATAHHENEAFLLHC